jgi:hypothetical protein
VQASERDELLRAARGDIPARYAHPLWISVAPEGDQAIVFLGLNEEPFVEIEEVHCRRERGRWHMMSSTNGLGFGWTLHRFSEDGPLHGLLQESGEAPAGVDTVVVRWNGRDHELPVTSGYFFFGVWDVPEDFDDAAGYPLVVRYVRSDGTSEAAPSDSEAARRWAWEREHRRRYLEEMRSRWAPSR